MHWQIFVNNIVFLFIIMADDYAVKSVTDIYVVRKTTNMAFRWKLCNN